MKKENAPRSSYPAKYESEEALVLSFLDFQRRTKPKNIEFVREFDGGLGLADLVFFRRSCAAKYEIAKLAAVNPRLAIFLDSEVAKNIDALDDLRSLLGTDLRGARIAANHLKRIGAIDESDEKTLRLNSIPKPLFTDIISIEAKLSDWRRGLNQAFRYTQFSNEAWLLLDDQARGAAVKNISSFISTGVGLATFSTGGKLFIHANARVQRPSSKSKYWRAQAILARL